MLIRCLLVFVYLIHSTGFSLRCFSDASLKEAERCEQRKGFRSCFIKYRDGSVTGRGCSTKNQIFGTSCENHSMGGYGEEKICYCSTTLCNNAASDSAWDKSHLFFCIFICAIGAILSRGII